MTQSLHPDKAALLATFEAVFDKIDQQGRKFETDPGDAASAAKFLGPVVAIRREHNVRELALISGGALTAFAKVNGKGYVETKDDMTEEHMARLLINAGDRVARTVPSKDPGMYHYSWKGPAKVL